MAKKTIPTWRMFMALGQGITSVDLSSGLGDKPSWFSQLSTINKHRRLWNLQEGGVQSVECGV